MAIPRTAKNNYLDGRDLFYRLYEKMGRGGSLNKLQWQLYNEGIFNTENGKPYSTSAIFQSIWRWMLNNLDEAKPIYKNYILMFGEDFDEDIWTKNVAQRVNSYFTKAQARKFFRDHPEYATQ